MSKSEVEWREIPGYEGRYEVSSDGQIRSLRRLDNLGRRVHGRLLSPTVNVDGYPRVSLKRDGIRNLSTMHAAVMRAFVGPPPAGHVIRHLDGNPANNNLSNLAYGTFSENMFDVVRHGRHAHAIQTHCVRGHAFTSDNIYSPPAGGRDCRRCMPIRRRLLKERKSTA